MLLKFTEKSLKVANGIGTNEEAFTQGETLLIKIQKKWSVIQIEAEHRGYCDKYYDLVQAH